MLSSKSHLEQERTSVKYILDIEKEFDKINCALQKYTTFLTLRKHSSMFIQLPDSVYRAGLIPSVLPAALVKVSHGVVTSTAVEAEVAKFFPSHPDWKWEAVPPWHRCFPCVLPIVGELERYHTV